MIPCGRRAFWLTSAVVAMLVGEGNARGGVGLLPS